MMKKLISLVVSLLLLVQSCLFVWASDVLGHRDEKDFALLKSLGIVMGDENGDMHPENTINRAEYTAMILRMLNMEDFAQKTPAKYDFTDVRETHWAKPYLSLAKEIGLVDGISETEFGVTSDVSYVDAVKILVCALGYRQVAEDAGGYPGGYLKVAAGLGILKNVNAGQSFTRANAVKMMKNALTVDIMDGLGQVINGQDVLSEYFNMMVRYGVVTGTPGISSSKSLKADRVEISGVIYKTTGFSTEDLMGLPVKCYVTEQDGTEVICHMVSYGDDDSVTVDAEDILPETSLSSFSYLDENEDKETVALADNPDIYFNGVLLTSRYYSADALKPDSGNVTLRDTDGNGDYDFALVSSYRYLVVSGVSETILYDKFGKHAFLDTPESVTVYDAYGLQDVTALEKGMVVSVAESKDGSKLAIRAVSSEVVGDVIRLTTRGGQSYYTIADSNGSERELTVAKSYRDALAAGHYQTMKLSPGQAGLRFLLNEFGEVCDVIQDEASGSALTYGYLVDVATGGGLGGKVSLKILTTENKLEVFPVVSSVRLGKEVNGSYSVSRMDGGSLSKALITDSGVPCQIVTFRTNEEGTITELNLARTVADYLYLSKDAEKAMYAYHNGVLGQQYLVREDTAVFSVHGDGSYEGVLGASIGRSFFSSGTSYYCTMYDIAGNAASAIVIHDRPTKKYDSPERGSEATISYGSSPVLYINDIQTVAGEDGGVYTAVTGYQSGQEVTKLISEDIVKDEERFGKLAAGVAIQYMTNSVARQRAITSDEPEQIIDFLVMLDYRNIPASEALWEYDVVAKTNAALFTVWGTLTDVGEIYCSVTYHDAENQPHTYSCAIADNTLVLEYDEKNQEFSLANIHDLQEGRNAFIRQGGSVTREVVLY